MSKMEKSEYSISSDISSSLSFSESYLDRNWSDYNPIRNGFYWLEHVVEHNIKNYYDNEVVENELKFDISNDS